MCLEQTGIHQSLKLNYISVCRKLNLYNSQNCYKLVNFLWKRKIHPFVFINARWGSFLSVRNPIFQLSCRINRLEKEWSIRRIKKGNTFSLKGNKCPWAENSALFLQLYKIFNDAVSTARLQNCEEWDYFGKMSLISTEDELKTYYCITIKAHI